MKKIIIILITAFLLPVCDKSSHRDSDTSMRIKPGALTAFGSPATSYDITFSGNHTQGTTGSAVIFNGNGYIGIAVSDNPDPQPPSTETFNVKIYFPGSAVPLTKVIASSADATITIIDSGSFNVISGGPMTLTINRLPDTVTPKGTYIRYQITSPDSIVISGVTLTITSITALYSGTNP